MKMRIEKHLNGDDYMCSDENGVQRRIDLTIDDGLKGHDVSTLIGRHIEVGFLTPWAFIGGDIELLEKEPA